MTPRTSSAASPLRRTASAFAAAALALSLCACTSKEFSQFSRSAAAAAGATPEEQEKIEKASGSLYAAVAPIPYDQEKQIGGGVAIAAFDAIGDYKADEDLQRYVNLVGKSVALASDRPDIYWRFCVLDSDQVNAFAAPGGYVFVTLGTLRLCHDESQLAGVLAHEVAHVTQRHAIGTLRRAKFLEAANSAASLVDPKNSAQYDAAIGSMQDTLLQKGYEQGYEYESDKVGTDIAAAAGYNPWGLKEFLVNLSAVNYGKETPGWFKTHPAAQERIKQLVVHLDANYTDFRNGPKVRDRFQKQVAQKISKAPAAAR